MLQDSLLPCAASPTKLGKWPSQDRVKKCRVKFSGVGQPKLREMTTKPSQFFEMHFPRISPQISKTFSHSNPTPLTMILCCFLGARYSRTKITQKSSAGWILVMTGLGLYSEQYTHNLYILCSFLVFAFRNLLVQKFVMLCRKGTESGLMPCQSEDSGPFKA